MKPFLKWVGGKTQILGDLRNRIPASLGKNYFEPFLGGGALFFGHYSEATRACILSDMNDELISTYTALRDAPGLLCDALEALSKKYNRDPEQHYYAERSLFNAGARCRGAVTGYAEVAQAARFILLNKTGFNGLYRENRKGGFNVPWGKHSTYEPDVEELLACSRALQRAVLRMCDFEESVKDAKRGDFVYFDPPYVPATATSNFTAYQKEPFGPKEQERLRDCAVALKRRGVHVLLSNSDTRLVWDLYGNSPDFKIEMVQARRNVNSVGSKRGKVGEVLIR